MKVKSLLFALILFLAALTGSFLQESYNVTAVVREYGLPAMDQLETWMYVAWQFVYRAEPMSFIIFAGALVVMMATRYLARARGP